MPCILRNSVVGSITSSTGGTSLTLTSSVAGKAGDVVIAIVSVTASTRSGAQNTPTPAGWTLRGQTADNVGPVCSIYSRTLTADGTATITTSTSFPSGIHGSLAIVAGAQESGIAVTFNTAQRSGQTTSTSVTSPASAAAAPVGSLPLTWHASYYNSSANAAWSTTLPSGRSTWQPTTVADTAIAGLATYPVTTSAASFATRSAVLSAARNSIGATVIVPQHAGPDVELVSVTAAGGTVASSSIWCAKPQGSAADDEPSTFRFSGQSTAKQRVIIQRFRNCHPTSPILTSATFGPNTATASTTYTVPSVDWVPRSMMVASVTVGAPLTNGWGTPTGMTLVTPYAGAIELANYIQLFTGTALTSGTKSATFNNSVSTVWNTGALVLRAADSVATGVEVLVAWHSMDASQSSGTMDTYAWGGWTLLGTMTRVSSSGAANYKVYYQIVPSYLSDPVWTADTDLLLGNNESTNPCCAVDSTDWLVYNSTIAPGGRVTDLVGMQKTTGFRVTRTSGSSGDAGFWAGPTLACTPGEVISVSGQMETSNDSPNTQIYIWWYTSDNAGLGYSEIPGGVSLHALVPDRLTNVKTAPPNAAKFRVMLYANAVPPNTVVEGTAVRIRRGSFPYLPYLDGDSYRCMWNGARGASSSQRDTTRFPDTSASVLGTEIGYYSTQRQDGNGANVSGPSPLPVESAAFGRPGRMIRADMPAPPYQRVEHNPEHRQFVSGDDYFFSIAFALPAGWPTWVTDYWVIEQLHAAPDQGSPVVSFECRDYSLRMRGGDNKPNPAGGNFGSTYAYNIPLLQNLRVNRWYSVIYRVLFSDQDAGGAVDVWVDGERKLSDYGVPGATVYQGGPTYRKQGAYKRPAIEAGEVYHAGAALGRSYGAVDPARPQLVAASDFAPAEFF